jgi:hypothetical protein
MEIIGLLVLSHIGAFVGGIFCHHYFATKAVQAAAAINQVAQDVNKTV